MFAALHVWYLTMRVNRLRKKNIKLMDTLHFKYGTYSA